MYIGDVGVKGFYYLVYEVVDNFIDEVFVGYCDIIEVLIYEDNFIIVVDNGCGILIGINKKEGKLVFEIVMMVFYVGGKFDKDIYKVFGGFYGVGVFCVNVLFIYMCIEVYCEGKVFEQEYFIGKLLYEVCEIGILDKIGIIQIFKLDGFIFEFIEYNYDMLVVCMCELVFFNKGICIMFKDFCNFDEKGNLFFMMFFLEGGLKEFVQYFDRNCELLIIDVIYFEGECEGILVEVFMIYNILYIENIQVYVNNINMYEGGMYFFGFCCGLMNMLKKYVIDSGMLVKEKIEIDGDDFWEGFIVVVLVKVVEL